MKNLRVLHIITTIDLGGAEKQLALLASLQVSTGYKATVLALKGDCDLERELRQSSIDVHCLSNYSLLKQITKIRALAKSHDIVHSHLPRSEALSFIALFGWRGKWVISRHNSEMFWPNGPKSLSRFLSRLILRKAKVVIAISHTVSDFLVSEGEISIRDQRKIEVIHYGISPRPNNQSRSNRDFEGLIGTVARLELQKDLSTLLKSFSMLTNGEALNWKLSIAGTGSQQNKLEREAFELGLNDRVRWLGRISDMDKFYDSIDVFVLPSLYEGFGLVLLEAMKSGVPIVCSDIPTSIEIFGEHYPGLFKTGEVSSLRELLGRVADRDFRRSLTAVYPDTLAKFSDSEMLLKVSNAYGEK